MSDDYPARIRQHLHAQRGQGIPWDVAWSRAQREHPTPEGECWDMGFMERHMRAAYLGDETRHGRAGFERTDAAVAGSPRAPLGDREPERRCRWGDGCDRVAGHGRTGLFCEMHGAELQRIGALLDLTRFEDWRTGLRVKRAAA